MLRSLLPPNVVVSEATLADEGEAFPLDPAEAVCVARAVEKRRREFAAGRHCARRALSSLGIEAFALLADPDRVPVWPPGIVGSITHSTGHCGAAVARVDVAAGLGVDVEEATPLGRDLVPRICTPNEIAHCERLPRVAGVDWPKLVFSAKESVYKAYYPLARTFLGFRDVEVQLGSAASRSGAFVATLIRLEAPAAAGTRIFHGHYAWSGTHVYTAVALPPSDSRGTA